MFKDTLKKEGGQKTLLSKMTDYTSAIRLFPGACNMQENNGFLIKNILLVKENVFRSLRDYARSIGLDKDQLVIFENPRINKLNTVNISGFSNIVQTGMVHAEMLPFTGFSRHPPKWALQARLTGVWKFIHLQPLIANPKQGIVMDNLSVMDMCNGLSILKNSKTTSLDLQHFLNSLCVFLENVYKKKDFLEVVYVIQ